MAMVLKCDASAAAAYVEQSFPPTDEVWISFDLLYLAAALADWTGPGAFADWANVLNSPSDNTRADLGIEDASPDHLYFIDHILATEFVTTLPTADAWHTYEIHWDKGANVDLYISGSLAASFPETTNQQAHDLILGIISTSQNDADSVLYVDNIKVGTVRGGSTLFSEDFEGGAPLDNFDFTSGDVSVVADPNPGPPAPELQGIVIAFDDDTLEPSPVWTRIDDPTGYRFATSYSITRGRQSELDKTGTGTATVNLIDKEGLLDPTNPSSPFAGTIDPMKQAAIALHNPVTDTWHTIFRGFISDWFYDVDTTGRFTTIKLELADAFDLLSALEMTPGHQGDTPPASSRGDIFFEQTVGPTPGPFQRINQILDDAGIPDDWRFTLTGNVQLQPGAYERLDQILTALFDTADAEFPGVGNIYVDKIGRISFRGRYSRFDPEDPDWQIDFFSCGGRPQADADPDNVAPITALKFRRSKQDIINAVTATPQLGNGEWTEAELASMFVKDDASIAQYGWRGESFENLLVYSARVSSGDTTFPVTAVDEVKLFARYYVDNYAYPTTRVDKVTFRSRGVENAWAAPLWAILTQIDIGDVLTVTTTHEGGGGFDADYFVEGLHYEVEPKDEENTDGFPDVTLELDLSPRALYGLSPFS